MASVEATVQIVRKNGSVSIDRTPPFGKDRCDICGGMLPAGPLRWAGSKHIHPECDPRETVA